MRTTFESMAGGPLRLYEAPKPGYEYVVGIDTATGSSTDYTAMQVLTRTSPICQVAVFQSRCPVYEAADFAVRLGYYYNTALVICEVNYPGNAVQDALIQQHKYPNNYQFEKHLQTDPDISDKYGFRMLESTKWLLIRELQDGFRQQKLRLRDKATLEELGRFVYQDGRRKTGAISGGTDDLVIALMLAYHAALMYPQEIVERPKKNLEPVSAEIRDGWNLFYRITGLGDPNDDD